MKLRMAAAVLSLVGLFIAAYLWLFKLGRIGSLSCGTGACETVQLSEYSAFHGIDVALIGVLGYAVMFGVAVAGTTARWQRSAWVSWAQLALAGGSVAFAAYLTWLELFVIHAICRWCVASAVIVVLLLGVAAADVRRIRETGPA